VLDGASRAPEAGQIKASVEMAAPDGRVQRHPRLPRL